MCADGDISAVDSELGRVTAAGIVIEPARDRLDRKELFVSKRRVTD